MPLNCSQFIDPNKEPHTTVKHHLVFNLPRNSQTLLFLITSSASKLAFWESCTKIPLQFETLHISYLLLYTLPFLPNSQFHIFPHYAPFARNVQLYWSKTCMVIQKAGHSWPFVPDRPFITIIVDFLSVCYFPILEFPLYPEI